MRRLGTCLHCSRMWRIFVSREHLREHLKRHVMVRSLYTWEKREFFFSVSSPGLALASVSLFSTWAPVITVDDCYLLGRYLSRFA